MCLILENKMVTKESFSKSIHIFYSFVSSFQKLASMGSEILIQNKVHRLILCCVYFIFYFLVEQKQRESYEVVVKEGKLMYKQSGDFVNTMEDSKWIFVLSASKSLYVGKKVKGQFQHSSFLAGGVTTASGRLVSHEGILKVISKLYYLSQFLKKLID